MLEIHQDAARILTRLLSAEKTRNCGEDSRQKYAELHRERFADILRLCRSEVPRPQARVLDVGRSELTAHLLSFYRNVQTLGLAASIDDGGHREITSLGGVPHIIFDLLESYDLSAWPQCGPFDLIVFSEVIEHLSVAPEFVLGCLGSLLADGGVLICTTPNAANIGKRLRLLLGRNPYERLRLYPRNPGRFREYTQTELCNIAGSIGLRWKSRCYCNWFGRNRSRVTSRRLETAPRLPAIPAVSGLRFHKKVEPAIFTAQCRGIIPRSVSPFTKNCIASATSSRPMMRTSIRMPVSPSTRRT